MKRPNPFPPDRMTTAKRLGELASILAAGVVRLRARKSSGLSVDRGESCLHFLRERCRHDTVETKAETKP